MSSSATPAAPASPATTTAAPRRACVGQVFYMPGHKKTNQCIGQTCGAHEPTGSQTGTEPRTEPLTGFEAQIDPSTEEEPRWPDTLHESEIRRKNRQRLCEGEGNTCLKEASYNYKGETVRRFCDTHKHRGRMVSLKNAPCEILNCLLPAFYAVFGVLRPTYCKVHRDKDTMRNVVQQMCQDKRCDGKTRASWGFPHNKKRVRCAHHMADGMINLNNSKCEVTGCPSYANYGCPKEKKKRFCGKKGHGPDDKFLFGRRECEHPSGCKTTPSFNFEGLPPVVCAQHIEPGMINVVSPLCETVEGDKKCTSEARCGFPQQKPTACIAHRVKGKMVFNPRATCHSEECNRPATHGSTVHLLEWCEDHSDLNDLNLAEKKCTKCGLLFILDENNLCEYCAPAPQRQYCAKEKEWIEFLKSQNIKGIRDKMIDGGACGRERPDFLIDSGRGHAVVFECDENQHKAYPKSCELIRILNLAQSLGGLRLFVVCGNPDDYDPSKGGKARKRKTPCTLRERYECSARVIKDLLDENTPLPLPGAFIASINLFFDGWNNDGSGERNWKMIQPMEIDN